MSNSEDGIHFWTLRKQWEKQILERPRIKFLKILSWLLDIQVEILISKLYMWVRSSSWGYQSGWCKFGNSWVEDTQSHDTGCITKRTQVDNDWGTPQFRYISIMWKKPAKETKMELPGRRKWRVWLPRSQKCVSRSREEEQVQLIVNHSKMRTENWILDLATWRVGSVHVWGEIWFE